MQPSRPGETALSQQIEVFPPEAMDRDQRPFAAAHPYHHPLHVWLYIAGSFRQESQEYLSP